MLLVEPINETQLEIEFLYVTPEERRQLGPLNSRVLERVRGMTREEGFASLVEAGIYLPGGELAPPYRSIDMWNYPMTASQ